MLGPRIKKGAPALLFDRLSDSDPESDEEVRPLRILDARELAHSVAQELERLLNTRCRIRQRELAGRTRSVIDYGLEDYSKLFTAGPDDQKRIAAQVRAAIERYEPRLSQVEVTIDPHGRSVGRLGMGIRAVLRVDSVREAVFFPVVASQRKWSVQADVSE